MANEFIKSYLFSLILSILFYQIIYYLYPIETYPMINKWINDISNKIYILLLITLMIYILYYKQNIKSNKKNK